jgi:maltooligosyltrehalose synthase
MKTPKILPWLARRHGVSEERAEALWAEAIRHATARTGWVGTSEYWKAAMDRLTVLLEREARSQCRPPLAPMVRIQTRLAMLPMIAWHGIALAIAAAWTRGMNPPAARRQPRPA